MDCVLKYAQLVGLIQAHLTHLVNASWSKSRTGFVIRNLIVKNTPHFHPSNRCGDGYGEADNYLCGQNMAPWDCVDNPDICRDYAWAGTMNKYGYPAHFDLQDANSQITSKGWDNPEVTWELVNCSPMDFGDWEKDCECPMAYEP